MSPVGSYSQTEPAFGAQTRAGLGEAEAEAEVPFIHEGRRFHVRARSTVIGGRGQAYVGIISDPEPRRVRNPSPPSRSTFDSYRYSGRPPPPQLHSGISQYDLREQLQIEQDIQEQLAKEAHQKAEREQRLEAERKANLRQYETEARKRRAEEAEQREAARIFAIAEEHARIYGSRASAGAHAGPSSAAAHGESSELPNLLGRCDARYRPSSPPPPSVPPGPRRNIPFEPRPSAKNFPHRHPGPPRTSSNGTGSMPTDSPITAFSLARSERAASRHPISGTQAGTGRRVPPGQNQARPTDYYDQHPERYYRGEPARPRSPAVPRTERVRYVEVPQDHLVTGAIRHTANLRRDRGAS